MKLSPYSCRFSNSPSSYWLLNGLNYNNPVFLSFCFIPWNPFSVIPYLSLSFPLTRVLSGHSFLNSNHHRFKFKDSFYFSCSNFLFECPRFINHRLNFTSTRVHLPVDHRGRAILTLGNCSMSSIMVGYEDIINYMISTRWLWGRSSS